MRNFKIVLQYEGTRYKGWQKQGGTNAGRREDAESSDSSFLETNAKEYTIQGKLERLLSRIAGEPVEIHGSGRTDAGVHAYGQVASFHMDTKLTTEALMEKINSVLAQKNVILEHLYHAPALKAEDIYEEMMEYKKMVEPYVCDVSAYLWKAIKEGKNILLEGQLGTMKDPDHGIYPMVTSSSTLAAYGAIGAGIPPYEIKQIITVSKAYSSAVGAGAFVSEIFGDEADELRRRGGDGGEFGATTGRPRRMGWFDCVATKYGCRLQGATDVAFTVLDVLGYLDEIPVCVGYDIDGEVTTDFPTTYLLEKAKPVYETLPGWKCDIRGIKKYEDLPENCRKYIEFIEKQIECPITMISNGPGRDDIIYRNK